jgi:hypothetical protein
LWLFFSIVCSTKLWAEASVIEQTKLDPSPFVDARASALGLAVSPIANGLSAPYYNPAAIGGLHYKPSRPSLIGLRVPFFGLSANDESARLRTALSRSQDISEPELSNEVLKAYVGKRQYARLSVLPNATINRFFIAYTYDIQVAAVKASTVERTITTSLLEQQGPYMGFSFASPNRNFYLGFAAAYLSRGTVEGEFTTSQLEMPSERKAAFNAASRNYYGTAIHAGIIWHITQAWRPTLAIVAHDLGGTRYNSTSSANPDITEPEDLTVGFSLSPNTGSIGYLNYVIEAAELKDSNMALNKKLRTSLEWTIGNRFGYNAGISFRLGYNSAGVSYGAGMNAGIVHVSMSSFAEDVGKANYRVIERRQVANFAINVADF